MKDSIFNSVTIGWLRTAFLIFFSTKVMYNKFDLNPKIGFGKYLTAN